MLSAVSKKKLPVQDIEEVEQEWVAKQKSGFDWKTAVFGIGCLLFVSVIASCRRLIEPDHNVCLHASPLFVLQ